MKIVSWNINGLRATLKNPNNELERLFKETEADIVFLQEVKIDETAMNKLTLPESITQLYDIKYNLSKTKKGYSGVAVLYKKTLSRCINVDVNVVLGEATVDDEGRIVVVSINKEANNVTTTTTIVNCYVPNSGVDRLNRLDFRCNTFEPKMRRFLNSLPRPLIYCGDLNVAPEVIDVYDSVKVSRQAGHTHQERNAFKHLLDECKLIDVFRNLNPTKVEYTYKSARSKKTIENPYNGCWRLDFFLSDTVEVGDKKYESLDDYVSSDHIPIVLEFF